MEGSWEKMAKKNTSSEEFEARRKKDLEEHVEESGMTYDEMNGLFMTTDGSKTTIDGKVDSIILNVTKNGEKYEGTIQQISKRSGEVMPKQKLIESDAKALFDDMEINVIERDRINSNAFDRTVEAIDVEHDQFVEKYARNVRPLLERVLHRNVKLDDLKDAA